MHSKIDYSLRPTINSLSKRLEDRVSHKIRNLFIQDIQNDCSCIIEKYEILPRSQIAYIYNINEIKTSVEGMRFDLPMHSEISDQNIYNLLETACKLSKSDTISDAKYSSMLFNHNSNIEKLYIMFEQYCGPIITNRSSDIYGWMNLYFVPIDCCYMLPEPENLGVISVNINNFGAFCITDNILKCKFTT